MHCQTFCLRSLHQTGTTAEDVETLVVCASVLAISLVPSALYTSSTIADQCMLCGVCLCVCVCCGQLNIMLLMQETIAWAMRSGRETKEYRSIEEHMDNIRRHLRVNEDAKESLTEQYKKKRWLDIGGSPDPKALVDKVLDRILSDAGQYDVFIEMLKAVFGMDIICKNIEGICSALVDLVYLLL